MPVTARPLSWVLLFAATSAFGIVAGPPVPVSTAVREPAAGSRLNASVASNRDGFAVAWYENGSIRVSRVARDGELLDPKGVLVGGGGHHSLSIASDGRDYLVAYPCNADVYKPSTCVSHFSAANGLVELTARIENAWGAALAWNGREFLAAYDVYDKLQARWIDGVPMHADGTVAGPSFRIADSPFAPAIASNGDRWLVVWSDYSQLWGREVSETAVVGSPQQFGARAASGPGAFSWSVASNGRDYLVAWQQNMGVASGSYLTELETRAVQGGIPGPIVTISTPGDVPWVPDLAWIGSRYLLTYTATHGTAATPGYGFTTPEEADVRGLAVGTDGQPLSRIVDIARRPGVDELGRAAWNGTSALIGWTAKPRLPQPTSGLDYTIANASEIEARIIPASDVLGELPPPFVVSMATAWQESLTGAGPVVAWVERVGEQQQRKVYANTLQAAGRGIAASDSTADQVNPSIDASFVAWVEQDLRPADGATGTVMLRRYGPDLGFWLGKPIAVGAAVRGSSTAVAGNGSAELVAWQSPANRTVAARVSAGGLLDSTPIALSHDPDRDGGVLVATDGTDFFVVWGLRDVAGCAIECAYTRLRGAIVSPAGTILRSDIDVAVPDVHDAFVVWNGSEYVVFWDGANLEGPPPTFSAMWAARFDRTGQRIDSAPVKVADSHAVPQAITWTGHDYLVAYRDMRQYPGPLTVGRIGADLTLVDGPLIEPVASLVPGKVVLLTAGGGTFIGYQRSDDDGVSRAVVRLLTDPATRRRSAPSR